MGFWRLAFWWAETASNWRFEGDLGYQYAGLVDFDLMAETKLVWKT